MPPIPVVHAIDCAGLPDDRLPELLSRFRDHGAKFLVMNHPWCRRIAAEPEWAGRLDRMVVGAGLRFLDAHSPYGAEWDLNAPDAARHRVLFAEQRELMRRLAPMGIRNYVIHIGRAYNDEPIEQIRELAGNALNELLPEAERLGIIICLENIRQPANSPSELLRLVRRFSTPGLGICYDSGHANITDRAPDTPPALELLRPHITTCHLHDNDGKADRHRMPGDGTTDWDAVAARLGECPRLDSIQSEVHFLEYGEPVSRLCTVFRELGEQVNRRRECK